MQFLTNIFILHLSISKQCSHYIPSENNRKPPIFLYFQWVQNGNIDLKRIKDKIHGPKNTAQKVSVFGVILVRIFPHSERIRRDTLWKMRTRITSNTDTFYAVNAFGLQFIFMSIIEIYYETGKILKSNFVHLV